MREQAIRNREEIAKIKADLDFGLISYDEAKRLAKPIVERINQQSREIAHELGVKPQLVNFSALMR